MLTSLRTRLASTRPMAVLAALTLAVLPVGMAVPAQAAGKTVIISPADAKNFSTVVQSLRPGDTLGLKPGVYNIGKIKPKLAKGTATSQIRITATDPSRPPEVRGFLIMEDADYWVLTRMKMVGTSPLDASLKMSGGKGWAVTNSEFTGAVQTKSLTNVVIDSNRYTGRPPSDWQFSFNCVHHASPRPAGSGAGYHNVYVNAMGGARGLIARNTMFSAPGGSNLKLGDGGNPKTPGVSGVRVENNTMHDASNQVLLFGNIAGISVSKNLFIKSTGNVKTGVYVHTLGGDRLRATSTNNYSALMKQSTFVLNTPATAFKESGNVLGGDPWVTPMCGKSISKHPASTTYGRWATR